MYKLMSIEHVCLDSYGKLRKSLLQLNDSKIEININCFEKYSNDGSIAAKNKIATLFESYRRREITPDQFIIGYYQYGESFTKKFLEKFEIFDTEFYIYFYKSNDILIGSILSRLRAECLKFIQSENLPFIDISDCLVKMENAPPSSKQSFETVIENYKFNKDILWDLEKQTYFKIERIVIVDDVISRGKAIYTLLRNLYNIGVITSATKINANFIYCVEKRFSHLLAKKSSNLLMMKIRT